MTPKKIHLHSVLFVAAIFHASQYSVAQIVMQEIESFGLILIRMSLGCFLFWIASLFTKRERINKKDFPRILWCAFFGTTINVLLFFQGLTMTSVTNAALIMTTTPILILVISSIMIKEKITNKKVIGILFGLFGVIVLKWKEISEVEITNLTGDLLIFVNAVFYGIYLVVAKPLMTKYHPITLFKWVFLCGSIFLALFVGFFHTEQISSISFGALQNTTLIGIIYIAIFTTFAPFLLNAWALKHVNASLVGIYIYLQPLLASIIALLLGRGAPTYENIIAAPLIFIGVYLVSKK